MNKYSKTQARPPKQIGWAVEFKISRRWHCNMSYGYSDVSMNDAIRFYDAHVSNHNFKRDSRDGIARIVLVYVEDKP